MRNIDALSYEGRTRWDTSTHHNVVRGTICIAEMEILLAVIFEFDSDSQRFPSHD